MGGLLNVAEGLHPEARGDFVVRQEEEVGQGGLTDLTQEIARAAGSDRDDRHLGRLYARGNAIEDLADCCGGRER